MRQFIIVAFCALCAGACSKSQADDHVAPPATATTSAPSARAVAPTPKADVKPAAAPQKTVDLAIASVGNTMTFDKATLTVPAGSKVHVTFKNSSSMTTMAHNWVLVKPGTEAAVAAANVEKADLGYISPGPDVLAFTPLAKAGQTTEVTFDAPPPGSYPYICSFPGHYIMMKGVLTVTP